MPLYMHDLCGGKFRLHIGVWFLKQLFLTVNFPSLWLCDLKLYWESMPELHELSEGWSETAWWKCGSMDLHVRLRNHPVPLLVKSLSRTHMLLLTCFPPQPINLWGECVYPTDEEVKKNFSYVPHTFGFVKCDRHVTVNLTFKNKTPSYCSFLNVIKTSFATPIFFSS